MIIDEKIFVSHYCLNDDAGAYDVFKKYPNLTDYEKQFLSTRSRSFWSALYAYAKLSEDFMRDFHDSICWQEVSSWYNLSEEFIEEFKDKVNWQLISCNQKISLEFIKKFAHKINYKELSYNKYLSMRIIKEFHEKLNFRGFYKTIKLTFDIAQNFAPIEYQNRIPFCYFNRKNEYSWRSFL